MSFLWDGIREALRLVVGGDADLVRITVVTLEVAAASTAIALAAGLPAAMLLGLGRFRGRRLVLTFANAGMGMGLPPVLVGLVVALLLVRRGPLGGLDWLYTVQGVIVAQAVLAAPVIVALGAASVQAVDDALLEQARGLGASHLQIATLALREARVGMIAATVAAMGSAFSEVGAVVLVGGNIERSTQTLASAILVRVGMGDFAAALAFGFVLVGLLLFFFGAVTFIQQRSR